MLLFPSVLDEEAFYIVFLVWIFGSPLENRILSRGGQGKTKVEADRRSAMIINVSAFASIIAAFASAYASLAVMPPEVFCMGIGLMVAGVVLREWAVATLKGYYSYRVRIREDHRLIEKGPYRLIRHPAYSGSVLTLLGMGVVLLSGVGLIIVAILTSMSYAYRIRVEERALLTEFGEEYLRYMKRTKRLIPFLV